MSTVFNGCARTLCKSADGRCSKLGVGSNQTMSERTKQRDDEATPASGSSEAMLIIAEAAELLGCSRPHVAMLIDDGRLSGAMMSGRHPRVTVASVMAYKKTQQPRANANYKRAAQSAGMYAIPDEAFVKALAAKRAKRPFKD